MPCPFCNRDPYHYVDNGVGMEAVAVVCCEPGIAYFAREPAETVTLGGDDFSKVGSNMLLLRAKLDEIRDLEPGTQEWVDGKVSPEDAQQILVKVFQIVRD